MDSVRSPHFRLKMAVASNYLLAADGDRLLAELDVLTTVTGGSGQTSCVAPRLGVFTILTLEDGG